MRLRALLLSLFFALSACVEAQLVPLAQPLKVRQLPACNRRMQNLQFFVVDSTATATCASGGAIRGVCVCVDGSWLLLAGVGSFTDHGGLAGLLDDDHPQYFRLGGRAAGQTFAWGGTVLDDDFLLGANAVAGSTVALSLEAQDAGSDNFQATLSAGANNSPSFRVFSDENGDGPARADINAGGGERDGAAFTVGSGRLTQGFLSYFTPFVFGWEGIIGLGSDSETASTLSCIGVSADSLFADRNCSGTVDAGEENLENEAPNKYVPVTSTTTTLIETTGAAADLDINVGRDLLLDIADDAEINLAGDMNISSSSGGFTLNILGAAAKITLNSGIAGIDLKSTSGTVRLNAGGGDAELTLGNGTIFYRGFSKRFQNVVTCIDNGAGTNSTLTILPTEDFLEIQSLDAQGCNVTMSESGLVGWLTVRLVVTAITAGAVNFADTAGVTELNGAFAAGLWDVLNLDYVEDRWVESGRSNN